MAVIAREQHQRRTVSGMLDQAARIGDFLSTLEPADLEAPSARDGWPLGDLVALAVVVQADALSALDHETAARPIRLSDWFRGLRPLQHRLQALAEDLARHNSVEELATQFRTDLAELGVRLDDPQTPATIDIERTPMRTLDLVRLLCLQWTTTADDLNSALADHRRIAPVRHCLADATRTLTQILTDRHPGQSIEVRVPPFAAVQCGRASDDPRHTRGTPPNVVECSPIDFVRLASGRRTFAECLADGSLSASGARSDLSDWLPLY